MGGCIKERDSYYEVIGRERENAFMCVNARLSTHSTRVYTTNNTGMECAPLKMTCVRYFRDP